MLSIRTETILKSIVGQYIVRAIPVASQSIVSDHELKVSPATIRNEMVNLEQEGYIKRQHHSAGSIPSDKGYRYYVESLGEIELPLTEQRMISHLFHQVEGELEEWLKLTAKLIAQLAQNMAIVTRPRPVNCRFQYLEIVALQELLALVVLVLRGARIRQQLVTFDQAMSQSELSTIARKLNTEYSGLTCSQIQATEIELSPVEDQLTGCLVKMMQTECQQDYEEPYLDGLHLMINQPEFADSHRLRSLMELIDQRSILKSIIPEGLVNQGIRVIIGRENKAAEIQDYSVVISRYGLPNEATGAIGIIGPTRMPYARAISTISYLSSVLSSLAGELYGEESRRSAEN
ncbi:MAG: heat-inducible transcriptional repressor HrcA [Dehalococcoidales bacterium]|nr:heat-inducible transcriptional repressor HrcA [Dehalococcoidales bacterium]